MLFSYLDSISYSLLLDCLLFISVFFHLDLVPEDSQPLLTHLAFYSDKARRFYPALRTLGLRGLIFSLPHVASLSSECHIVTFPVQYHSQFLSR